MGEVFIISLQAFVLNYTLQNRKSPDYQDGKSQFYHDTVEWKTTLFFPRTSFQVGKPAGGLHVKEAKPKHHLVQSKKSHKQR